MKLLASLLAALSVGSLMWDAVPWMSRVRRPAPDWATRCVRRGVQHLLSQQQPWLCRYVRHIQPILTEVPLPNGMDLALFLALHAAGGFLIALFALLAFPGAALVLLPAGLATGAGLPYVWLKRRQHNFHGSLFKALPDYLELQALVMEAGLDLQAGLQHYLDKGTPTPLQALLRETQIEIQRGRSRGDAFMSLSRKTLFLPLRDTCRGIVQALALGTRLAPLLRQQAVALRLQRLHVAEKKAAEAPLKVLFPLFVFIFPTIFIVLLGPIALLFVGGGF